MKGRGFTLMELIVVMLLTAILAAFALPRFFGAGAFANRGFSDQALAALRYAQKDAVAMRRNVCVNINAAAGAVALSYAAAAGAGQACNGGAVLDPASGAAFAIQAPGGVGFAASAAITFDSLGRPVDVNGVPLAAATLIQVTGDAPQTLTVEPETGYAH